MIAFNADEIFQVAVQIEHNGAAFYRAAAAAPFAAPIAQMLRQLADMEDLHERRFMVMREALATQAKQPTTFDPEGDAALYLKALADSRMFDWSRKFDRPGGPSSVEETLREALGLEKDSIVFYLGMFDLVPQQLGKERIQQIIEEEKSHVRILSQQLAAMRQ